MGWQSPSLIVLLFVSFGASAPGAQLSINTSDTAVLAELKLQTVLLNNVKTSNQDLKNQLVTLNQTINTQKVELSKWQTNSIFLMTAQALCLAILWGCFTWFLVVKSMQRDSLL